MSPAVLFVLVGFALAIASAALIVRKTRRPAARIALALVLLPPIGFCLFGFAATFEPMDAATAWTFRAIYAAVGLGLTMTILMLVFRRPAADSPSASESKEVNA